MKQEIYVLVEHIRGQVTEISYLMLAAAQQLAADLGDDVVAVLMGYNQSSLANDLLATRILYYDHLDLAYFNASLQQQVMANLIQENHPRLVLFGDTTTGVEVAGPLSARLDLPLVSYCKSLRAEGNNILFTIPICGGKLLAEGILPAATTLVSMIPGAYKTEKGRSETPGVVVRTSLIPLERYPVKFIQYIEPAASDVDISKAPVLVAVGRGIQNQDNLEMVEELADALGGVVCASRPVVDQGWLPLTRLVGKSGKRVKPSLYLALGISGATEHVEAIADSEMIVAINTDPQAPIYNLARYGATLDLLDLVPTLTEAIRNTHKAARS